MNGFRVGHIALFVALTVAFSGGCAASRGKSCRDGGCRTSSTASSAPPSRMAPAQAHVANESARGKVQKMCPVTGEKLGSMGSPIRVTVGGKTIQVCCQGCVADVKTNPDKYFKIVADELAPSDISAVRSEAFYNRPAVVERSSQSPGDHHH